jgi:DNA-binding NtrC family response regulator
MSKILVVDDDKSVSMALRITLQGKYDVTTAGSAADAFNHMADNRVDLVLLDIKMPEMNGLEALQEIKGRHPEMTVVILTAYPTEENVEKAWELGANGFLSKPFELDALRDFVDKALSEKSK